MGLKNEILYFPEILCFIGKSWITNVKSIYFNVIFMLKV